MTGRRGWGAELAELHDELNDGVVTDAGYTVAHAIREWLADGLAGRAPKTVSTQREVLEPLIGIIGAVPLRELTAAMAHAEANDKVRRNVATLVDTPAGQGGPPVQVPHLRAGRGPDPGGTVVRFLRLRRLEPP